MSTVVDLSAPDTYKEGHPHELFRQLRDTDPVSWRLDGEGNGYWAITRYHDAMSVLRSPQTYSSWRGSVLMTDPSPEFLAVLRLSMLNRDPPDHTWMRRLVNKALNPRRIAALEQRVHDRAHAVIAEVRPKGRCDFAQEVAEELPLFMISEILGVPESDRRALYALTDRMFTDEIMDPVEAMRDKVAAVGEMRRYGAELGVYKKQHPADDLATELATAELEGRTLVGQEFEAFFMMLFNAGTDTTRSLLSYGLDFMLDRPDIMDELRREPDKIPAAIEEMLRYVSPMIQLRRTANKDVELGGKRIAEGDRVVLFFPSANRDEAKFADPDRFDMTRTPNDHITFGYGTHFCIGAPLARLEAKHLFTELLAQLQRVQRASPIVQARTNFIRSVRKLEISYS